MFEWMSEKGKNVWEFLVWFYIFTYIPVIPAFILISFKGIFALFGLIYFALSLLIILKLYLKYEKIKKQINTI